MIETFIGVGLAIGVMEGRSALQCNYHGDPESNIIRIMYHHTKLRTPFEGPNVALLD